MKSATETRTYTIRAARQLAEQHGLRWPSCYANESQASDILRFKLRRRLRRELPGLTADDRERLIWEAT